VNKMNGQEFNNIIRSLTYYCKKKHITKKVKENIERLKNEKHNRLSYIFELACFNGNVELVRYLLESNVQPPEIEPLKFFVEKVCQNGQKEVANLLIENGYPTNELSIQRMMLGGYKEGIFIVRKILGKECVCHDCLVKMVCVEPCNKVI
jgi:hypothetical protein